MGLYTSAERTRALETGEYTPDSTAATETIALSAAPASADIPKVVAAAPVAVKIEPAPLAQTIGSSSDLLESMGIKSDAPLCMTCGVKMRMSGACFVCEGCGNTSGCS
jgi:ribonucleoside-diphosphate reductase alpha chain